MTKIIVTEADIREAWDAWNDALNRDFVLGFKPTNYMAVIGAVVHALAERWSAPQLDPVVSKRLEKLAEEARS